MCVCVCVCSGACYIDDERVNKGFATIAIIAIQQICTIETVVCVCVCVDGVVRLAFIACVSVACCCWFGSAVRYAYSIV